METTPYTKAFKRGLHPGEVLTVSQWADKHRKLSDVASAEPGQWRTSRTPYLREVMDTLSIHNPVKEVVFMKGAQVGATEAGLNWIGYIIHHAPGPTLLVQPTDTLIKRIVKQRVDPLIRTSPVLYEKVKEKKHRDSGNTLTQKDFEGGTLIMAGANSAVGLRSAPIKYAFLDEVEGYPSDLDGEGDPVTLVRARQRTFAKRKLFMVSTPAVEAMSKIEPAFDASDQRFYEVPCPHCNTYQKLVFGNLKYEQTPGKQEVDEAQYVCNECGVLIDEHYKTDMLAKGKWVAKNPGAKVVGFHLNSLYSPLGWYSWAEIATDWIKAQKNKDLLKGFINTVLGETWKDRGDAPDYDRLYERRENYEINVVPKGAVFITGAVDVQADRIEIEIIGWGRRHVSWSIDYRVIMGDPKLDEVWDKLDEILVESWPHEGNSKVEMKIKKLGIDSGYLTQRVYAYVRKHNNPRVVALKGQETLAQTVGLPKAVDVNWKGEKVRRGLKLWKVGTNHGKSELYSWLKSNKAKEGELDPIGYCHYPEYGLDYFKMLTAEELVTKVIRGFHKSEWIKVRPRNEALDIRVYNRAVASMIGIDRFRDPQWIKLEKEIGAVHTKEEKEKLDKAEATMQPKKKKQKIKRRDSKYWG